ncbi:hypothetical protein L226DRAFT_612198 [Lentinus tigrinus ALCF2SS1-7]|uniref:Uncharacterized protein n=1 Tax=Lentinus tigrinus ALCF2SS1-6 TaxID=1328759 RepID=A0A5C2SF47_9APHY|nr:hypothetical protein L227DRAFT_652533 [Lentinus tigrinus ALCF2SS1-6]RPD75929.1 hypothetical protein L226DRAFT_612198 [Lentinus tigrinus ALCF2SS1-7]
MPAVTIPCCPTAIPIDDASDSDSAKENVTTTHLPLFKSMTIPKGTTKIENPFSVAGIPKLEKFVNLDHLPDILVVYDKGDITNRSAGSRPVYYKRAYPKAENVVPGNPRRAALFLDTANCIDKGRRSSVYQAPFIATLGPKGAPRKHVLVAAKVANNTCRCHQLLRDEARGFSTFPDQFFDDTNASPWALGPEYAPLVEHLPAMRPRYLLSWAARMNPKPTPQEMVPPIAPRFYGYYVPIESETSTRSLARSHRNCEDFQNSNCDVSHWPKSIMLMEDCGRRINPGTLPLRHRVQCLQLVERMHLLGFSHGHARASNMLVQPGPLSLPQEKRSMDTPSFRLISLGRWRGVFHPLALESAQGAMRAFVKGRENDVFFALHELRLISAPTSHVEKE